MKILFSLAFSAAIWHASGLDKIAASVPAVWHSIDSILKAVAL